MRVFKGPWKRRRVADRIAGARADAEALLGARPGEVAFMSSGSSAFGLAFAALPPLRAGDRILVGRQEWGGNLATMRAAADRAGAAVEAIPCREGGSVDAGELVSFTVNGVKPQDVRVRLAQARITVGVNGVPYTPLDMTARNLPEIVRASVSYLNTEEEIAHLADAMRGLAHAS